MGTSLVGDQLLEHSFGGLLLLLLLLHDQIVRRLIAHLDVVCIAVALGHDVLL